MSRIVTFGEIMLRLSPPGYMRFFQNDQLEATFAGAEANVAVSLANFGEDVAFVTKVPDNPVGLGAVRSLRAFNVDTSDILLGGDRLGIYFMEKGASQRGSLCVYDRGHSSIQQSELSDFDWDHIFNKAEWFHFTGITPALSDSTAEICLLACKKAKEKGLTISCDLNYRSKLWSREKASEVMSKLCEYADVCIANEEDAKDVFGIEAPDTDIYSGVINSDGYRYVAETLTKRFGFNKVAITLRTSISANDNKWAGMLFDRKECYYSRQYDLHIVDRVGGGDSFGAGLIYSLINGFDSQNAIEFAVAASALKHSIKGDFNRVSVDEVTKLVKGNASGRVQR